MPKVRIVHWRPEEAGEVAEACRNAGFEAEYDSDTSGQAVCRAIRGGMPDAVAIDLSRKPGHGREVAAWVRRTKSLRRIPIVFVNGAPDKVERTREVFPDAVFATTTGLAEALGRLEPGEPEAPVRNRYPEKTVGGKLGIIPGATVGVMDAPRDYLTVLGDLPEDAEVSEDPRGVRDVMLWFVDGPDALDRALRRPGGKMWIVWRKGRNAKTAPGGLTQHSIRAAAAERGLVDYKICALDARWSGMLFARRRA